MMWDKLTDLACKMLSTHPTEREIKNLRKACFNTFYGNIPAIDHGTEAELWQTVNELDMPLKNWDENTASLLRFYPAGSNKTARFDRYEI